MHSALHQTGSVALPQITPVRPMLMITGFLGAGKTTLLRSLLDQLALKEHLADVILNDCENAQLDRETLRDHAASIDALTGTCVCCEGLDELCRMILRAAESKHSVLLIELNGTADPIPLQETFTLLESKFLLHPRWQVCVIDARHFGKRSHFQELEKLQLETASHYYLSHTSAIPKGDLATLSASIKAINPLASQTNIGDLADSLSQTIRQGRSHAITSGNHLASDTKPNIHHRHHVAHEFTGCNIVFPDPIDESKITPWLEQLPPSVIRTKALLTLRSAPDRRHLYERVGMEVSPRPIPVRSISRVPCSALFIGPDLNPSEILEFTQKNLHPNCHFPEK